MKQLPKYLFLCLGLYLFVTSCKKEKFTVDPNSNININTDTLWFDTVFTKVSLEAPKSVNKQILIYNPYKESIRTSILLGGGSASHFRLNVDGEPGFEFKDIEIFPNDSIFLFVEVHPDPNNNSPEFNPLIIKDSVIFNTNGNQSKTMLVGWGQDAHYIFRDSIETDTTWANEKLPIVVYGYCYVKPDVKLTIEKNMKIHFAPRSWLFVEGQLDMRGQKDEPIVMQGDRLQPDWEETAGQWGGVWISYPSYGNLIEHSLIKNATVGVYCDSTPGIDGERNVTIRKTMIRNMSFDGISGQESTIHVENSVSTNCGRYTFLAAQGGNYTVLNSTFYTGGRDFSRQQPTFGYTNIDRDEFGRVLRTYDIQYTFLNNIIDGIQTDGEIGQDLEYSKVIAPSFADYNIIKTKDPLGLYGASGSSNILSPNMNYIDASNYNFDLDTLSPAKNKGVFLSPTIPDDFCNRTRIDAPDIGAYESQF